MNQSNALTFKFNQTWQIIENELQTAKKENLLPFSFTDVDDTTTTLSDESIAARLDTLKREKFTIAVCGDTKTGKSTILNALLFGENVLPSFETPLTAKLSFIEYTDKKNYFVVNFYSDEEWKNFRDNLNAEDKKQLDERIKLCAENEGIYQENCLGSPSVTVNDLKKLGEYVSDPESGKGKYTPFVKDVHIFINNENIKDVRIVDTPGLNDPNTINSRETIKWIENTHAVIFVLPLKSIGSGSFNFFNLHLLGTRPGNRVWVINQIDNAINDYGKSIQYLRNLGKKEDFKQINLFGNDEKICGYSALIVMLRAMRDKGIEFDETQRFHFDKVSDDFEPDPHHFADAVAERLYQNTGIKRIAAGFGVINDLYARQIKAAEKTIILANARIEDAGKSEEELSREVNFIKSKKHDILDKLKGWISDAENAVYAAIRENVVLKNDKSLEKATHQINMKIDACSDAASLKNIPIIFQNECKKIFGHYGSMQASKQECLRLLREEIALVRQRIENLFIQNGIDGGIDFSPIEDIADINTSADDIFKDMEETILNNLPDYFFSEWFCKKAKMHEKTRGPIFKACSDLHELITTVNRTMETEIKKKIADGKKKFAENINESFQQKQIYLESDKEERQSLLKKAEKDRDAALELKAKATEMQRLFKHKLPQEIWL